MVCFSGDGSLKMNIQEMATAAQENVNVKIVLFNNQSLGLVHQQQNLFYGKRIMASRYERPTDFLKIAEGFGMRAVNLDPSPNPCATLAEALNTPGPCLIHATIDPNEFVHPMVPPGAANLRDDRLSPRANTMSDNRNQPVRVHPRRARATGFHKGRAGTGRANHPGVMSHICGLFARARSTSKASCACRSAAARPAASGC